MSRIETATWLTGSRMYGIHLPDSDFDYTGIEWDFRKYMNPLLDREYTNVSEENNISVHSLPKVAKLLTKGNFTILDLLYHTPLEHSGVIILSFIEAVKPYAVTNSTVRAYLGYINKQTSLAKATGRGKQAQRPLVQDGDSSYEPKFVGHLVRGLLSIAGILNTGEHHHLTNDEVDQILSIRRGEVSYEEVQATIDVLLEQVNSYDPDSLRDTTELREVVGDFFYDLVI